MTRKDCENTRVILSIVTVLLYCVMVFFLFRTFAYNKYVEGAVKITEKYNAIEVIFGCDRDKPLGSGSMTALNFSFMCLLPHILIILAIILLLLKNVIPALFNKYTEMGIAALFFIAGILLFFTSKFVVCNTADSKQLLRYIAMKKYMHTGWASYFFGVVTLLCSGVAGISTFLAFKQDSIKLTKKEEKKKQYVEQRSQSLADMKKQLLKEMGRDENEDVTKKADEKIQAADDQDLVITSSSLNEAKGDEAQVIDVKLEDK